MIITCNNCNKKFDIESSVIPEKGRLLQCNACNHKWFFKKEIINEPIKSVKINIPTEKLETFKEEVKPLETESPKTIELLDTVTKNNSVSDKISIKDKNEKKVDKYIKTEIPKIKKNYNILALTIIFITSLIAIIIVADTFQKPISSVIPNIEFLLYNLYETINDIVLFFSDLI